MPHNLLAVVGSLSMLFAHQSEVGDIASTSTPSVRRDFLLPRRWRTNWAGAEGGDAKFLVDFTR